ncbi:MAG: hypothetical protein MNPFHGCM_03281 [Gemmatimonadaceae bacterium]|nr:hypothetical protein [Gemmatimonadaceae bacterium]
MDPQVSRELRFLKRYAVAVTALLGTLSLAAFRQAAQLCDHHPYLLRRQDYRQPGRLMRRCELVESGQRHASPPVVRESDRRQHLLPRGAVMVLAVRRGCDVAFPTSFSSASSSRNVCERV